MTHIHEAVRERPETEMIVSIGLGGLRLRDENSPQGDIHIPTGVAIDIPMSSHLATLHFTDGSLGMEELKQLLLEAHAFHIPADEPVVLSFGPDSSVSVSVQDEVTRQILQYYVEKHPGKLTIHQNIENPSVFRENIPVAEPDITIPSPALPIGLVQAEIDA